MRCPACGYQAGTGSDDDHLDRCCATDLAECEAPEWCEIHYFTDAAVRETASTSTAGSQIGSHE